MSRSFIWRSLLETQEPYLSWEPCRVCCFWIVVQNSHTRGCFLQLSHDFLDSGVWKNAGKSSLVPSGIRCHRKLIVAPKQRWFTLDACQVHAAVLIQWAIVGYKTLKRLSTLRKAPTWPPTLKMIEYWGFAGFGSVCKSIQSEINKLHLVMWKTSCSERRRMCARRHEGGRRLMQTLIENFCNWILVFSAFSGLLVDFPQWREGWVSMKGRERRTSPATSKCLHNLELCHRKFKFGVLAYLSDRFPSQRKKLSLKRKQNCRAADHYEAHPWNKMQAQVPIRSFP